MEVVEGESDSLGFLCALGPVGGGLLPPLPAAGRGETPLRIFEGVCG